MVAITTIITSRPNRLTPTAARLPTAGKFGNASIGPPDLIAMDDEPYETQVMSNCKIVVHTSYLKKYVFKDVD